MSGAGHARDLAPKPCRWWWQRWLCLGPYLREPGRFWRCQRCGRIKR